MIITRTPLRISFCGGGTDLPSYFKENGGCVISTTINKYIYISINDSFDKKRNILKYSDIEDNYNVNHIKHPIIRETMRRYDVSGIELNSTSDIPSGTGMGSSSSFTVGIINGLRAYNNLASTKACLAEEACNLEINILKEDIGYQDQYAAAYGDLNYIEFKKTGETIVEPLPIEKEMKKKMSDNLLLFYLGGTRNASKIIHSYSNNTSSLLQKKEKLCELTLKLKDELKKGNVEYLGKNLYEGWKIKKSFSQSVSNEEIDEAYETALDNGAVGGKLLGAGGSGFLLIYANPSEHKAIKTAMSRYPETSFDFESEGSSIIYNDMNT